MKQTLVGVAVFSLAACVVSILIHVVDTLELQWAIAAGALGLVGVGLSVNSAMLALRTDSKMNKIDTTLLRIEDLQREIRKEQKEQTKDSSPIVMSLQALSQYYVDWLAKQAKQKSEDE